MGSSLDVRRDGMSDEASATSTPTAKEMAVKPSLGPNVKAAAGEREQADEADPHGHAGAGAAQAEDGRLPEEDAPGLAVAHAHRLEDADLAGLLHGRDGQRGRDAEGHRDQHEELDGVAGRALRLQRRAAGRRSPPATR